MPIIKQDHTASSAAPPARLELNEACARLAASDPVARRAAAHALGEWPEAAAVLLGALGTEPVQAVRSAILGALARIGSEEAVAGLADCLRGEDVWLRNAAIDVLRDLPEPVAAVIAHLLLDWNRDVRILAVSILDTLRHECVEEWLLQLIEADPDLNVCGAALNVLAEVATEAARQPVTRARARFPDEPYIAFTSTLVLNRLARSD